MCDVAGEHVLDTYDAVIVGGSIHMGKHEDHVADFVRKNRATLERLPSAFFSVSLAAHGDKANAEAYVANFEEQTGWRPAQVGFFGGALLYRQYGFLKRLMMKKTCPLVSRHQNSTERLSMRPCPIPDVLPIVSEA